jgi:hypothetical protein
MRNKPIISLALVLVIPRARRPAPRSLATYQI